jgi:hypothetical protein
LRVMLQQGRCLTDAVFAASREREPDIVYGVKTIILPAGVGLALIPGIIAP